MTPGKLAVQKAIQSRLSSALSVEVGTDPGEPGVEVGDDTEAQASENTSSVHTDVSTTVRAYHTSETEAKKLGKTIVSELTDRSDKLTLDSPFSVLRSELIDNDTQRTRRVDGPDLYTELILIDHRVTRS